MADRSCRVGLHGRNNVDFEELDYQAIRDAKIETLKMMGQTKVEVFRKIKEDKPGIEFITRLYDPRFGEDTHPSPQEFAEGQVPVMNALRPYCLKFEIHNEPNHRDRYEGWGQEDSHARDFNQWFLRVYDLLKNACPWASLGFPGLAIPHRDLEWADICRPAIERADWLGVHCYWQTPPGQENNHLDDFWGLRFKSYHERFPDKIQEITECGNSNIQANPPIPISEEDLAAQYVEYFQELFKYPYINSASFFMLSSQDSTWEFFAWRTESGRLKPVVEAVGNMPRPRWVPARPTKEKKIVITTTTTGERFFEPTGHTVKGAFLKFFDAYGLDICGYPISEQFVENGLQSQYFQRIALEETSPGQIRLKLVGTEALTSRERIAALETQLALSGNAVPPPSIKNIVSTLPQHPTNKYPSRPTSDIKRIIIHHTVLGPSVGPDRIARVLVDRGRPAITYHYFVGADGTIFQTNQLTTVSEHTEGHNADSIAVAFAGDFTQAVPTQAQIKSGARLIAYLMGLLGIPASSVMGAKEVFNTQSPGQQWDSGRRWKATLLKQINTDLKSAGGAPPVDQAKLAELQAEIDQLKTGLDQARQALAQAQQELAAAQAAAVDPARLAELQAQVNRLQSELARTRQTLAQTQAELAQARAGTTGPAGEVKKPAIRNLVNVLPRHETERYPTRPASQIKQIIVHHTAIAASVTAERIARAHIERGLAGITYHYLIGGDGDIQKTNELTTTSSHTPGHSENSLAIAFAGDFTAVIPTEQQLQAGGQLIAYLLDELNLSSQAVRGASELLNTQSPGQQWLEGKKWKNLLLDRVNQALAAAPPAPGPAPANGQVAALKQRITELEMELALLQTAATAAPGDVSIPASHVAISRPNIQDVVDSLPRHSTQTYARRSLNQIKELVVHHSAIPASISARRIAEYQVTRQNWPGIGYHFYISADGTIEQTNDLETIAYHVKGRNATTVGVCFAGDFSSNPPTPAQVTAGAHLLAWLLEELNLSIEAIKAHKDYLVTQCPGDQWEGGARWRDRLFRAVQDNLAGAGEPGISGGVKRIKHAMLFWQTFDDWGRQDLIGALNYIGRFRPLVTFSPEEAGQAEYVTIVGGPLGVSPETEANLRAAGSQVERIAGDTPTQTRQILNQLATSGQRFKTLTATF
ncbi:MAG: N-acetylmuramoyl-L-alanine amidase [Anaerolineae bacterium]